VGARNFLVKVNTNAAYRARFIKDPIKLLASEGITLSAEDQTELLEVIDAFRGSLPNLGTLPKGYGAVISAVQKVPSKKRHRRGKGELTPMFLP